MAIDYFKKNNAKSLQAKIEKYWRDRGYHGIKTWLTYMTFTDDERDHGTLYFVRSNIGPRGFPPKRLDEWQEAA